MQQHKILYHTVQSTSTTSQTRGFQSLVSTPLTWLKHKMYLHNMLQIVTDTLLNT